MAQGNSISAGNDDFCDSRRKNRKPGSATGMSEYIATVSWERGDQDFCGNEYSRGHSWTFDGGLSVPASA